MDKQFVHIVESVVDGVTTIHYMSLDETKAEHALFDQIARSTYPDFDCYLYSEPLDEDITR